MKRRHVLSLLLLDASFAPPFLQFCSQNPDSARDDYPYPTTPAILRLPGEIIVFGSAG